VKTKAVDGKAMGALFNIHQLQRQGLPKPLKGDNDWTRLTSEFTSGDRSTVTINMLLGGWGQATGRAWYDDVQLTEIGPAASDSLAATGDGAGKLPQIVRIVARHYADRAPVDSIIATLGAVRGADAKLAEGVLEGLVTGWPDRADAAPKLSGADAARLQAVAESLPTDLRDRLLVLAGRWGHGNVFAGQMQEVLATIEQTLTSAGASPSERADAARRMIRLKDDAATIKTILAQITPQASSDFSAMLLQSIADSRADDAAGLMIAKWSALTPPARAAAVNVMLRRVPWTAALLKGIEQRKLARNDLTASDWQTLKSHRDREIAALARKLDTTQTNPDRVKVIEAMLPALAVKGDVAMGQKLYVARCAQCHAFNGAGGKLGPELSGIGVRDTKEILAEIIDPNRSVEANYRAWEVETKSRNHYSGRLDAETQTTVELLDATGQRHVIERKDIRSMNVSNLSVMPVGLIDTLNHHEVSSLLEYLKTGRVPQAR
jgi:putative heme-binding domain-containing protein